MVEIYNGAIGPELSSDFLAGYDRASPLNQHSENLEWLFLKRQLLAVPAKFASFQVHFESGEANR